MEVKGRNITIRRLKKKDIPLMKNWGSHKNLLLEDYNFPDMTNLEMKLWYRMKEIPFINRYYSIWLGENIIGYLGIKGINIFDRSSTLGLVMDPNYTSKGYGREALYLFLDYYFNDIKMKTMNLEVNQYNERAYRLYKKLGFVEEGFYLDEFFNQDIDFGNPYFIKYQSSFVMSGKKIYNYIYRMKLNKGDFLKIGAE